MPSPKPVLDRRDFLQLAPSMAALAGLCLPRLARAANLLRQPYLQNVQADRAPILWTTQEGGIGASGLYTCGAADFQSGVAWLHTFLAARQDFVLSEVSTYGYQAPADLPNISAVTVAEPGAIQALAPGSINYAAGTNLGPSAQASTVPLPRNLSNTFV